MDGVDDLRVKLAISDGSELRSELASIEATQLHSFNSARPLQLGQEWQQWVKAVQLVRAVGKDQHQRCVSSVACQIRQHVASRPIRPVQVLNHEHHRSPGGEPLEHGKQEFEQPALGGRVA